MNILLFMYFENPTNSIINQNGVQGNSLGDCFCTQKFLNIYLNEENGYTFFG